MSYASFYYNHGIYLATILEEKGVTASANDGLTTLVNKILTIQPTITGLTLQSILQNFTYNTSANPKTGDSITITGKLIVDFLESSSNIELLASLQGATINIYENNTLLGSSVTDNNGEITFTTTLDNPGTRTFKAVFNGTDDYIGSETVMDNLIVLSTIPNNIVLSASSNSVNLGNSITLTGTVTSSDNLPSENYIMSFYEDGVLLGTSTTNSEGVATYTVKPSIIGDKTYTVKYDEITSNTSSVSVNKGNPSLSITTSASSIYINTDVTVSGVLKDAFNNVMSNETIQIYNGSTLVTTTSTNNNGAYSVAVNGGNNTTALSLKATFPGNNNYNSKTSSTKSVSVILYGSSVSISASPSNVTPGNPVTITMYSSHYANQSIYVNNGYVAGGWNNWLQTTYTPSSVGTYSVVGYLDGDSTHYGSSGSTSFTCSKIDTSCSISVSATSVTIPSGQVGSVTLSGTVTGVTDGTVILYQNGSQAISIPFSNGSFSKVLDVSVMTYNWYVVYAGDTTHNSCTSNTVTCTGVAEQTKINTKIVNASYSNGYVSGVLLTESNTPVGSVGVGVEIYGGGDRPVMAGTNNAGAFSVAFDSYGEDIYVYFDGNSSYNGCSTIIRV